MSTQIYIHAESSSLFLNILGIGQIANALSSRGGLQLHLIVINFTYVLVVLNCVTQQKL